MKQRLIVGMSGASGAILAVRMLELLREQPLWESHLVCSAGARLTLAHETSLSYADVCALADVVYEPEEVGAAIASGSFRTAGMVVAPCSMKTLAGITTGYADNLLLRAADVALKERRPLVLLTRETPLHQGHLENMARAVRLGAVVMPPVLTYYTKPRSLEDMERHLAARALDAAGVDVPDMARWTGL